MNAGRLVAKPIRARVPGSRYGLRLARAAGPRAGPGTRPSSASIGVSGSFWFDATALRRTSGPEERTSRGPHMKTWLWTYGDVAT